MKQAQHSYKSLNTLKMYLGITGEDYWHIDYNEYTSPYDSRHYFWDLSKKALLCDGPFDENGILKFVGEDGNVYYHIINLCHYAIGAFEVYLQTKNDIWLKIFLKHADWLCRNQKVHHGIEGVWVNNYPIKLYKIFGASVSAMTQGMAISVLTRAYFFTDNKKYLNSAIKAVNIFQYDVCNGGIRRKISQDFICYEEYPTKDSASCVLNGFITAILGLYDLNYIYHDTSVEKIYNTGLFSLLRNLEAWDNKWWSLYDLYDWKTKNIASFFYHKYHIKQLKVLYKLTQEKKFRYYQIKWDNYMRNYFFRIRALLKKTIFRLDGRL